MDGIINVCKERGYTSHDVVAKLRGILHMKKIGHTGTLDPEAEGVLPVCLGKGTGLCAAITDYGKTYEAVMLLGTVTDTQDTTGEILKKSDVDLSEVQILDACNSFTGEYDQIPPMYSALKHNGKKLYELARQGIEVERPARKIYIKSIHINDIDLLNDEKTVTITVECSKGTYIRTLCHDIGEKLGCGACMKKLVRTRVGRFELSESMTLSQIETLVQKNEFDSYIIPVDEMFSEHEKVIVPEVYNKLLYNGNKLPLSIFENDEIKDRTENIRLRIYDSGEKFIGLYKIDNDYIVPVKMFYSNQV